MLQSSPRIIPSVNELLESLEISKLIDLYPRQLVVEAIREVLEVIRQSLTNKTDKLKNNHNHITPLSSPPCERGEIEGVEKLPESRSIDLSPKGLYPLVQRILQQKLCGIGHAINATGIILHTGLGRAPLADEAVKQLQNILQGFCTLEIERHTGRRGSRYHSIEQLICMITGAESAFVVNNNAAAVLLTLDTLARGMEVIISRSQLVEIGGSFRMPDVMLKG